MAKQYQIPETKIVNVKFQDCDVYCGRGSKWGNPFKIGVHGNRNQVIEKFATYFVQSGLVNDIEELRGLALGCHCRPQRCHLDIIVEELERTKVVSNSQGKLF
jgi:hypothetical protein